MDLTFGRTLQNEANKLAELGKDPNQISKILWDRDSVGINYGIGIILDGQSKPMGSSSTILEYIDAEIECSKLGDYMNSAKIMDQLKAAVLTWQRIPEKYWDQFQLALPSDAGTGAIMTALEVELILNPTLTTLGIEELGWPAYKAMTKVVRIACREFPSKEVIRGEGILPLYQAGPMNTSGLVQTQETIQARAKAAAENHTRIILDRAYSGFEYARLITTHAYDAIMRMSYESQIQPFIEHGVSFSMAVSPTKAFVTFAFRPCGLLLLYSPEASQVKESTTTLNTVIRARGSSFEHLITRAFAKALINDLKRLEDEHTLALQRLAEAEMSWRKFVQGTPIEQSFSEHYAGLFRNLKCREDAAIHIYNQHLYPVLTNDRCRLNVTGIPVDEAFARAHVAVFASQCYEG